MANSTQYSDAVVAGMQILYGEGFLSPGGAGELRQLFADFDPSGMHVLDIGCGLGGSAITLLRKYGAAYVTGIDIEPELVARAVTAAKDAGLEHKTTFHHVEPGPLSFDDQSFDLVLTKDVICHMPDKYVAVADFFRVLNPGGSYICTDFFDPGSDPATPDEARGYYDTYLASMAAYGLTFNFEPQSLYEDAIRTAGFDLVDVRDHTLESADVAGREKALLTGDTADAIREALGEERFKNRLSASDMRQKALASRGFLHGHIHARKPA